MGRDSSKTHINAVKELILDEQKIVTYISVSKDLCIHANNSKFILRQVVDDIRSNHPNVDLSVSYLISGLLENNKARTAVCMETDLQNVRDGFQHIFFEHVYSINSGSHSNVDAAAFATINRFEDLALCTGHIKNDLCVKLSTSEIGHLKSNSKNIVEPKLCIAPQKKIKAEAKPYIDNKKTEPSINVKPLEVKSESSARSKTPSPKKDFNHAKKLTSKNGNKTQKGIAGFFNQSNNVSSKVVKKEVVKIEHVLIDDHSEQEQSCVKQSQVKQEQSDVKQEQSKVKQEPMDIPESQETMDDEVQKKQNKKKEVLNSSLTKIKKHAKVDKKRKRVLHVSDSESEDEKNDPFADEPQANHDSDDEIPPTPSINTVKITSGIVNPKKRRKIIDKTYTDEDGYILTKKEEIYESCSENEEEVSKKENIQKTNQIAAKTEVSPKAKKSKKKVSPPQKGKQTNIMSFFKKN